MTAVSKKDVPQAILNEVNTIFKALENEWFVPTQGNLVPTVFVGRVSPQKFHVGWIYADRNTVPGQEIQVCHSEAYAGPTIAFAVIVDGYAKIHRDAMEITK